MTFMSETQSLICGKLTLKGLVFRLEWVLGKLVSIRIPVYGMGFNGNLASCPRSTNHWNFLVLLCIPYHFNITPTGY